MALKKKDKFDILLSEISVTLKETANYFADFRLNNASDLRVFSETIKNLETKGDSIVHELIKELNNAFITPIEREDILDLAMKLDDVLDGIEHTSALFEMYSIINADEFMREMVEKIRESVIEIDISLGLLFTRKRESIRQHTIKIKELESSCDGILRKSIKHLFSVEKDPIRLIKYKEIYENLEEVSDFCQNVANSLETIIMKNS
jgi:predicted phosphate transport protein (TIGR00153 family)